MTNNAITTWLHPLRPLLDPSAMVDWCRLKALDAALDAMLTVYPVGAELPAGSERSRRLRMIRLELARCEHIESKGEPPAFQLLAQFICGYRDIDLRDVTGLGHGELIARHGSTSARQRWIPRLRNGDLAGIAVTESHGGSRPSVTHTRRTRTARDMADQRSQDVDFRGRARPQGEYCLEAGGNGGSHARA